MGEGNSYRVLGPLEVEHDGHAVALHAAKQRVLLAGLLLRANRTVSVPELTDMLWGPVPPTDARGVVQKYVMRLRRTLEMGGSSGIRTEPDGYRIDLARDQLDLARYDALLEESGAARAAGDRRAESALLRRATGLWRAVPPLADLGSESLQRGVVPSLVERYLRTVERRLEVELELGRHGDVAIELAGLVQAHPLRERFWAQWMRALHGVGRRHDALRAWGDVVALLFDELGVRPGPELRAALSEVLTGGPPERPSGPPGHGAAKPVPVMLPREEPNLVGRRAELDRVVQLLGTGRTGAPVPVVVITGAAGAGKTGFAVRAAREIAHRFPDGQLFADLKGRTASTPGTLDRFLRALGMHPEAVPPRAEDRVLAYRSLLADRRVLVLLDDARDEAQVRMLLPGSPDCAVLVTSRHELGGLAVSPGAEWLGLCGQEVLRCSRNSRKAAEGTR